MHEGSVARRRRDRLILASGPALGAGIGAITNLVTSTWNWWMFGALVVVVTLAAAGAIVVAPSGEISSELNKKTDGRPEPVCTLPPKAPVFVGREKELHNIAEHRKAQSAGRPMVCVIVGGPGSGKTQLATQAAHGLLADYPDGQLFFGFRSHAGESARLDVRDVLINALTVLAPSNLQISFSVDELSARWRAVTTGKRLLIVLDDIVEDSQIKPLLPNSEHCMIIVTARGVIAGVDPDIPPVLIGGLSSKESEAMIIEILRRASCEIDLAAVGSLAVAHHLPLNVRHIADQLVNRSALVPKYVELPALDNSGRENLTEPFRASIDALAPRERSAFRSTALYPGTHITEDVVSALAGISVEDALGALEELHRRGIVSRRDSRGYEYHDLVRSMALTDSERHDTEGARNEGRDRLFWMVSDRLSVLNEALRSQSVIPSRQGQGQGQGVASLLNEDEAIEWLSFYFDDLASVARLAVSQRWPNAWRLTVGLSYFMRMRRNIPQALELNEYALEIALAKGDLLGQAMVYATFGTLQRAMCNYIEARAHMQMALSTFPPLGSSKNLANCYSELGMIHYHLAEYNTSCAWTRKALRAFARISDTSGVANSEGVLGMAFSRQGNYGAARRHLVRALSLYGESGKPRGQAWIRIEIGIIERAVGNYEVSRRELIAARDIYSHVDDQAGVAWVDRELGVLCRMTGDYLGSLNLLNDALRTFAEANSRRNMADAYIELCSLYRVMGSLAEAWSAGVQALDIYREIGNERGRAWTQLELGVVDRLRGRTASAGGRFQEALRIYEQIEDRSGLARAHQEIGLLASEAMDLQGARAHLERAQSEYAELGSPEAVTVGDQLRNL